MSESTIGTIVIALITAIGTIIGALIQNKKDRSDTPTGIHLVKPLPRKRQLSLKVVILFAIAACLLGFISGLVSANSKVPSNTSPITITETASIIQTPPTNAITTISAIPTPTMFINAGNNAITIESIPGKVSVFNRDDKATCNYSNVSFDDQRKGYKLNYTLPASGEGSCNLQFNFDNPQDLTSYNALEFVVEVTNRVAFTINLLDDKEWNTVSFSENNQNTIMTILRNHNNDRIMIPLKDNYTNLGIKYIRAVSFAIFNNMTQGSNVMTFSDIKFIK